MPLQCDESREIESPEASLVRFKDEYHWEWRTIVKVMNRTYHASFTIAELKQMYKRVKNGEKKAREPGRSGASNDFKIG